MNQCYVEASSVDAARQIVRTRDGKKLLNRPVHITISSSTEFMNTVGLLFFSSPGRRLLTVPLAALPVLGPRFVAPSFPPLPLADLGHYPSALTFLQDSTVRLTFSLSFGNLS